MNKNIHTNTSDHTRPYQTRFLDSLFFEHTRPRFRQPPGAAIGIFFLGFCLGGVTEFGSERAVRRFVKVQQYRRGAKRRS